MAEVASGGGPARSPRKAINSVATAVLPVLTGHWHWVVGAQIAAALGTLVLLKVVSNLVAPTEFGKFALILAVAGGVNTLAYGPVIAWASRHYQEAREAGRTRAYRRALILAVLVSGIATSSVAIVILALLHDPIQRADLSAEAIGIGLAFGLVSSANEVGVAVANAALRRRTAALFLTAGRWVPVVAVVVGGPILGIQTVEGYAASMALGVGFVVAAQLVGLSNSGVSGRGDWGYVRSLINFGSPYFAWGIPSYLISFGDRLLLAYFAAPSVVGSYVAMSTATTNVVSLAAAAANRVLEPALFRISGSGENQMRRAEAHRIVRVTTVLFVLATAPVLAVYASVPESIIGLFAAPQYASFADQLALLLVASILFFASQQLILHGVVEKRPWIYLPSKFAHAGVLLASMLWLIPEHGLPGLVMALLAGNALQLVFVIVTNRLLIRR